MRFTFNGIVFAIQFRHDKSRNLGDHWRHHVGVTREMMQDASLHSTGFVIWCDSCKTRIGQVSKRFRDRKTYCVIKAHLNGEWVDVFTGTGDPNEQEGDRFCKEIGRRASLSNALQRKNWTFEGCGVKEIGRDWPAGLELLSNLRATFKQAAWAAYEERKQNGKRTETA